LRYRFLAVPPLCPGHRAGVFFKDSKTMPDDIQHLKVELQFAKRELNEARAVIAVLYSWSPNFVSRAVYQAGFNASKAGGTEFNMTGHLPETDRLPTIS